MLSRFHSDEQLVRQLRLQNTWLSFRTSLSDVQQYALMRRTSVQYECSVQVFSTSVQCSETL